MSLPASENRAPSPSRGSTMTTVLSDLDKERRRVQRLTGSRSSSGGTTSIQEPYTTVTDELATPAITSGEVSASNYSGQVRIFAAATVGGSAPSGRITLVVRGAQDGRIEFPDSTRDLDIGCSASGLGLGQVATVRAWFIADDLGADLSDTTLNLVIESERT